MFSHFLIVDVKPNGHAFLLAASFRDSPLSVSTDVLLSI